MFLWCIAKYSSLRSPLYMLVFEVYADNIAFGRGRSDDNSVGFAPRCTMTHLLGSDWNCHSGIYCGYLLELLYAGIITISFGCSLWVLKDIFVQSWKEMSVNPTSFVTLSGNYVDSLVNLIASYCFYYRLCKHQNGMLVFHQLWLQDSLSMMKSW